MNNIAAISVQQELAESPLVSVVMPCYNVASTLAEAAGSVLAQSHNNLELILVNDGSTDDLTPQLCDSLGEDARVRVIHQTNTGLPGARNTGIANARGEFIALLDSDDMYEPDKLSEHVSHLSQNPRIGLSFSHSRFLNEAGKRLPMTQGSRVRGIRAEHVLCRNPIGNGSAAVLRRSALPDVARPATATSDTELFDTALRQSEDVEFWFRFITTTQWDVEGIDKPLTLYRLSAGGLSADTAKQLASWEVFLDKASGYAPSVVDKYGSYARAYQLRYLARRCVHSREARLALRYATSAVRTEPGIMLQEPGRTLVTLLASIGLQLARPFLRTT